MKKWIASLMAAVLLLVAGCGQNTTPSVSVEEPDEWGITLSAEDVTPTGMTLVCTQSGGEFNGQLETGSYYALERLVKGEWLPVGIQPGLEVSWTMEAWCIQPNFVTRWKVNWECLYGHLEPGTYRMSKGIMDFWGTGQYAEKTYYAKFSIEK